MRAARRFTFAAGHRVYGHENKCANLHGHNYVVIVEAESDALDLVGRVIDFSVLKERVGGWIDEHWDHGFILHRGDDEAKRALACVHNAQGLPSKLWVMGENPTAENLARHLLEEVCPQVLREAGVVAKRVVVWETENCYAEASL